MLLEPAQQQQSAQVWVCDSCGTKSGKQCVCDSTAHMEELLAVREAARQRQRKSREKTKQNQWPRHSDTNVENIEEFPDEGDSDEVCWRRGLMYRASNAAGEAAFEDWSEFSVDAELVQAAERAARAWGETAAYLRRLYGNANAKD